MKSTEHSPKISWGKLDTTYPDEVDGMSKSDMFMYLQKAG